MKSSRHIIVFSVGILWIAGVAVAAGGEEPLSIAAQQTCCFENPRFSGTCRVTPDEDESCGDILAYLNNPNSVGKDYCDNTGVRGGWTTVSCEETSTSAATNSCRTETPAE